MRASFFLGLLASGSCMRLYGKFETRRGPLRCDDATRTDDLPANPTMTTAFGSWRKECVAREALERQVKHLAHPDVPLWLVFEGDGHKERLHCLPIGHVLHLHR